MALHDIRLTLITEKLWNVLHKCKKKKKPSQPNAAKHTDAHTERVTFSACTTQASYFLDFPDSWLSLYKPEMKKRHQESVCDRRRDTGGEVTSFTCHCVCQVLTRWQCRAGILLDKSHYMSSLFFLLCVCVWCVQV